MLTFKKKQLFCEKTVPGKRKGTVEHCFSIDKLVFKGKTKFQDVLIFDNKLYGRVLFLDGILDVAEKDEFIYHEMIVHPVLFSHQKPENVLIIGGGDGGTLREVLKHDVKKVDLVEIDKDIIELSEKYLKFVCKDSFSDKRVNVHIMPGQDFIAGAKERYDVVIVDCTNTDAGAISSSLYSEQFYVQLSKVLKDKGVMITLGASFLDFNNLVQKFYKDIKAVFPFTSVYKVCIPSFHCGDYSFIAGSKAVDLNEVDFKKIERKFKKLSKNHNFKHYSVDIHKASMVLPGSLRL